MLRRLVSGRPVGGCRTELGTAMLLLCQVGCRAPEVAVSSLATPAAAPAPVRSEPPRSVPDELAADLLRAVRRGGLIAVAAPTGGDGPIEVLAECRGAAGYAYLASTERSEEGTGDDGGDGRADASGAWVSPRIETDPEDLNGPGCARATHVVARLDVGAADNRACEAGAWRTIPGCDHPLAFVLSPVAPPRGPPAPEEIAIEAGTFTLGTDAGAPFEGPPHLVTLSRFFIDRTEVSVAAYRRCVQARRCPRPDRADPSAPETHPGCTYGAAGHDDHPVNCVSWRGARAYCRFVGRRLPTEAEWERAARGTDRRPYGWGEAWPPPAWAGNFADETARDAHPAWTVERGRVDGFADTAPVGLHGMFDVSAEGVHGLAGNVREWVADRFGQVYRPGRGPNPTGADRGGRRVVRGASFGESGPRTLAITRRKDARPETTSAHVGFRCARDAPRAAAASAP